MTRQKRKTLIILGLILIGLALLLLGFSLQAVPVTTERFILEPTLFIAPGGTP